MIMGTCNKLTVPLAGIELMHMLKKGQMVVEEGAESFTPATQFYALAA